MTDVRLVNVGQAVVFHDSHGKAFDALVTTVWCQPYTEGGGLLNLVMVQDNPEMHDTYGRQIFRETSVCHKDHVRVHGFYWRFADEEPNQPVAPEQV